VATGKYQIFGFLKFTTNELIGYELAGMNEVASAHGYAVKVVQGNVNEDKDALIERCAQMRVAGWVALQLAPNYQEALRQELRRFSTPLVVLDNSFPQSSGIRVVGDDRLGVLLGIQHLYELGHRRIAFVGGPLHSGSAEARRLGYHEAMQSLGLPLLFEPVPTDYLDGNAIAAAAEKLLLLPQRPTAILCVSDIVAMVTCRTARRLGLEVPRQLSVVGYDNQQMTAYTDPPLTSVAQPFEEMGRMAARRLLEAVEREYDEHASQLIEDFLPPHLVVRESTAPLNSHAPLQPI
jgi:DNA-binding LacI/PurR family transcriptional regulator